MMKSNINLRIHNNLRFPVELTFFNRAEGNNSPSSLINQKNEYVWDITPETFVDALSAIIEVKKRGAADFETITAPMDLSSSQGACNALNSLSAGFFFTYNIGASTFISTINDDFLYGTLNITYGIIE